jgi:hypothetical protein
VSRPELVGRWACYLCQHDQYEHNLIQGCPYCTCMATPAEAGRRSTDAAILSPTFAITPYSLMPKVTPRKKSYPKVADLPERWLARARDARIASHKEEDQRSAAAMRGRAGAYESAAAALTSALEREAQ